MLKSMLNDTWEPLRVDRWEGAARWRAGRSVARGRQRDEEQGLRQGVGRLSGRWRARCLGWLAVATALLWPSVGRSATYYLDPVRGSMGNPGTSTQPWGSLEAVAASGRTFAGGDLLLLRSGHHGSPVIRGKHSKDVVIRPVSGARVTLGQVSFRDARHWRLRGVTVSPETAPIYKKGTLAIIASTTTHIVIEQCDMYSVLDSSGWTAAEWVKWACNGVSISGAFNSSISNRFLNVKFGAQVSGVSNRLAHCVIQNFSADGIRGLGNYCKYESNVIQDSYKVDTNHDDAFQSWSVGAKGVGTGVVKGVELRGNYILNYSDSTRPMRSTLQGIGCFDGFYEGWQIENNVVMVNHWHGISLYGARNCRIVNNTVTDLNTLRPGPPWIRIAKHKNGQSSTGNVVYNNLSPKYVIITGSAVRKGNLVMDKPTKFFRDYPARDLRLKAGSPAIDAGYGSSMPLLDLLGTPRPLDGDGDGVARIDVGAYEYVR